MSPEILLGDEFDLPTDIFSLGIIFCEIISRRLADENTFKRHPPFFGIDPGQVYELVSSGCPPDLISLALECCEVDPRRRPTMVAILARLRQVELEVLARPTSSEDEQHVGSVKFLSSSKRPSAAPRIPSFGAGVNARNPASNISEKEAPNIEDLVSEDSDEELETAVKALADVKLGGEETKSWRADGWGAVGENGSRRPLINKENAGEDSVFAEYSTTVIRSPTSPTSPTSLRSPLTSMHDSRHAISSIITVKGDEPDPAIPPALVHPTGAGSPSAVTFASYHTANMPSFMSASIAAATEGGSVVNSSLSHSTVSSSPSMLHHRFTLLKPGSRKGPSATADQRLSSPPPDSSSWSPFDFFFFSGGLVGAFGAKCDVCHKRLGLKALLECDDCGLR